MPVTTAYTQSQLMVTAAARTITDGEVVFVGMRLPLLGFLLAKSTHAPSAVGIYELGIVRDSMAPAPILTMGDLPNLYEAQWLADTSDMMGLLQQGRVNTSFIGGAQIDRFGNLNTSYIGGVERIATRLPGSGGATDVVAVPPSACSCSTTVPVMSTSGATASIAATTSRAPPKMDRAYERTNPFCRRRSRPEPPPIPAASPATTRSS